VTDLDLRGAVEGAAAGDAGAWNDLVDRYAGLVWAVARGEGLNQADAADVCQTTWLRLAEHLDRINSPERVGTWLARTARHECWRVVRSVRRVDSVEPDRLAGGEAPAADAELLAEEEQRRLWNALGSLSPPCRTLLRILVADPPPSYAEVSQILDMPIGSIGPRRARCLDRLRELVDPVPAADEQPAPTGSRP
jgi:RNA polymerase sigma factor (sigma-70 family)